MTEKNRPIPTLTVSRFDFGRIAAMQAHGGKVNIRGTAKYYPETCREFVTVRSVATGAALTVRSVARHLMYFDASQNGVYQYILEPAPAATNAQRRRDIELAITDFRWRLDNLTPNQIARGMDDCWDAYLHQAEQELAQLDE